ncbi:MAG TPA: TIGR03067 domain-containing protein [Candidatus Cybelea sp.]|nr:TIGR03067 domain-containing protein [Candidatus Cybelea sp.]
MKYIFLTAFIVAATTIAFAADPLDDAIAIQGSWIPAKAELAGQPMTDDILKTISLKLDHGKYEVFVGEHPDRGTYTIDPGTKPKSMSVTGTEGPNQGKTFPAIYELAGDTLRICYDLSGTSRPAEFKSVTGTKLYLVTYHRKKN